MNEPPSEEEIPGMIDDSFSNGRLRMQSPLLMIHLGIVIMSAQSVQHWLSFNAVASCGLGNFSMFTVSNVLLLFL